MRFTGTAALVTGAASGMGLAVAKRLTADGAARLVLIDRDAAALARITASCTLDLLPGEVADEAFWHDAGPYLDGLDVAVVNAGVAGADAIADLPFARRGTRRGVRVSAGRRRHPHPSAVLRTSSAQPTSA